MSGVGEASSASLKYLLDHLQSAKYCRQVQPRLCGQNAQCLFPSPDRYGPILLA